MKPGSKAAGLSIRYLGRPLPTWASPSMFSIQSPQRPPQATPGGSSVSLCPSTVSADEVTDELLLFFPPLSTVTDSCFEACVAGFVSPFALFMAEASFLYSSYEEYSLEVGPFSFVSTPPEVSTSLGPINFGALAGSFLVEVSVGVELSGFEYSGVELSGFEYSGVELSGNTQGSSFRALKIPQPDESPTPARKILLSFPQRIPAFCHGN